MPVGITRLGSTSRSRTPQHALAAAMPTAARLTAPTAGASTLRAAESSGTHSSIISAIFIRFYEASGVPAEGAAY